RADGERGRGRVEDARLQAVGAAVLIFVEADRAGREGVRRSAPGPAVPGLAAVPHHRAGDHQGERLAARVEQAVEVEILARIEAAVTVGILVRPVDHRDLPGQAGPARGATRVVEAGGGR